MFCQYPEVEHPLIISQVLRYHLEVNVFKLPIINNCSKARSAVVQWLKGDIFQPDSYKESMKSVDAVVSCVGAFGSNEVSNC